jgi:hypothetical protein
MPALSRPTLGILLHEVAALAGRHEHEDRVGLGVLHALEERREIGIGERRLHLLDHLAATGGEVLLEEVERVIARRVVEVSVATFLMPFFTAQSAMMVEDCASVKLVRTI